MNTPNKEYTVRDVTDELNSRLKNLNPDSMEITIVRDILLRFVASYPQNLNMPKSDVWKSTPPEIIRHIFSFLSENSASHYRTFSLVCKSWRNSLDPVWKPLVLSEAAKLGIKYEKEPKSWKDEYKNHVIVFRNVYPTRFNWHQDTGSLMMPLDGAESHVWFGPVPAEFILQMKVSFPESIGDVGRHGGVLFSTEDKLRRWDLRHGWTIDWIDRRSDHGYRIGLNSHEICAGSWRDQPDPGEVWKFTQTKTELVFEADGKHVYKTNNVWRKAGYLALWDYGSNSSLQVENLVCWKI